MLTADRLLPMRRAEVARRVPLDTGPDRALYCDPVAHMQAAAARIKKENGPQRWRIRDVEDHVRMRMWLDVMAAAFGYAEVETVYEKGCEHLAGLAGQA